MAYLVLSRSQYRFADENTGEIREGLTLQVADEPTVTDRVKGLQITKVSAPLEALPSLEHVPAYYDIDYKIKPGAGGKAIAAFQKATFLRPLPLKFD